MPFKKIHYLSKEIQNAKYLSPSKVPAYLNKPNWLIYMITNPFSTTGGACSYSKAFISTTEADLKPSVAFVSDRFKFEQSYTQDVSNILEIDYNLVKLEVPFCQKDKAKELGCVWIPQFKTWGCSPAFIGSSDSRHQFIIENWLPGNKSIKLLSLA